MSTDLAIRTDLSQQVAVYVDGIEAFRQNLKDWDSDHIDDVRTHQIQLDALEKAAQQTKLSDLQKEVSLAKIEVARWMGRYFKTKELDGAKLNLDRMTVSRYEHVADTPDFVFTYAVEGTPVPSINRVLNERKRYLGIKAACEATKAKSSTLKRMFSEGYSVYQAERELNPTTESDDLGLDLGGDEIDFVQVFNVESFEEAVIAVEDQLVDLREKIVDPDVEFSVEGYQLGIGVLKRLRAATKEMTELFGEVKRRIG